MHLSDNFLTNAKPLRKISSKIRVLNLRNNLFNSLDTLPQVNFATETTALNLEEGGPRYFGDSVEWVLKMPFTSLERLGKNIVDIEIDGKGRVLANKKYEVILK